MSSADLISNARLLPLHYDPASGYGLLSMRPSLTSDQKKVQHQVVELKMKQKNGVPCEVVLQFGGGGKSEQLSKSKIFSDSNTGRPYVFAADEHNGGIMLYDVAA